MIRILKIILSSGLLLTGGYAGAQARSDGSSPQFLFPDFIKGEVRMKNGRSQFAMLNYNMISEKMVYRQDEKVFDMIETGNIDTVYILKSKFVPASAFFYEVAIKDSIPLFIQHKGNLISPGKPAAFGGMSQVSSSTYMSSVQLSSGHYNLKLPEDYEVKPEPVFWIKKNGAMHSFISGKQFLKIFPESSEDLRKYISQNRLKFDSIDDMVNLIIYCNSIAIR